MSTEIWIHNDLITAVHRAFRDKTRENTETTCLFICTDFNLYIYIKKSCCGSQNGINQTLQAIKKPLSARKRLFVRSIQISQAAVWLPTGSKAVKKTCKRSMACSICSNEAEPKHSRKKPSPCGP